MARFLFCPWPAVGDIHPTLPVAIELRARGHEVHYCTGEWLAPLLAGEGFPVHPLAGSLFDSLESLPQQTAALLAIVDEFPADVLIDGVVPYGVRLVSELRGIPQATLCVMACPIPSQDLPPHGMALPPPRDAVSRILAKRLREAVQQAPDDPRRDGWDAVRSKLGLKPSGQAPRHAVPSQFLILIPTTQEFEYYRSDLPPQAHFIGPLGWHGPADPATLARIRALTHAVPLIYVSQGTAYNVDLRLLRLAMEALKDEPVQLLVTTCRELAAGELAAVPSNTLVERYVPLSAILDKVDLVITHGGAGTVHAALSWGIPLLVSPFGVDQPENAQRCVEAGVGLRLDVESCSPARLREAVHELLRDARYRENARRVQQSYARHNAPREAALLLEQLARTRRPVLTSSL